MKILMTIVVAVILVAGFSVMSAFKAEAGCAVGYGCAVRCPCAEGQLPPISELLRQLNPAGLCRWL